MDKIIEIDENGKIHHPDVAPPPSDAAPVVGTLAVALADGFRNMGSGGDDVSHPANWSLGAWVLYAAEVTKLYAHPEDAPGGPTQLALLKAAQKNLHAYGENDDTERGEAAWALAARIDLWILELNRLKGETDG